MPDDTNSTAPANNPLSNVQQNQPPAVPTVETRGGSPLESSQFSPSVPTVEIFTKK